MSRSIAPEPPGDLATRSPIAGAPPLRIHQVAELIGLTPRSIRYYEEMGLLSPSARSRGSYRLFDQLDIDRLRFIKGLRDDAGFSIAEIGRLLEDEAARRLAREALASTDDPAERHRILSGRLSSIDDQLAGLNEKLARLQEMVAELQRRRRHVLEHLAELAGDAVNAGDTANDDDAPALAGKAHAAGSAVAAGRGSAR
ncbi:MAG: MerR family transcriptional regulator [Candidatus Limnocylindrales bacterium]|nr:MerR family transcriptional regulator [Candidatus Limnocylindrales bacterium]